MATQQNKPKTKIFIGSGAIIDPETSSVIARFDHKTKSLKTSDKKVIALCEKMGCKEAKKTPEASRGTDPLYEA